ncbi:MAG: PorV/PorQ family protein [candidate division KSB1 bacterium]|jgi:long-subunit fatty acid transport protein|nr:PorV/PorQ family protein [candidate division KSB1 bacterium]
MDLNKLSIITLLLLVTQNPLIADTSPASTGLAFLKIGAGGRAAGMGEAYTAVANDASAAFWNPAGLARMSRSEFTFTHNNWFQDISHEYLAFAFQMGKNTVGLSFISTNIGGIERRTNPSTEPLDIIEAHDIMFSLSFARSMGSLNWGVSAKYLYEKIYLFSANGIALDLGLTYNLPIKGLTVGATALNLGTMTEMDKEAVELPATLKAGVAYTLPVDLYGKVLIAGDYVNYLGNAAHMHLGFEYLLKNIFALRTGYMTGYEEKSIQAGAGIRFSNYSLDYGFSPFNSDIGDSHRISLSIRF